MTRKFNIQIEERAKLEIAEAFEWYEIQKNGLGEDFLNSLDNAFKAIKKAPKGYSQIKNHRQFPLNNFPFVILYEIDHLTIFVDAVFHTSRNPKNKFE